MLLQRVVVVIKALASRGLPFRESTELFGSNYMMWLEVLAEYQIPFCVNISEIMETLVKDIFPFVHYLWWVYIELLGKKVTDLLEEAKSSQYFSLIVDSTPDISHVDQLSFVIRYVKQNVEPVERFLKFLPHIDHKALDMFNSVIDTSCNVTVWTYKSAAYDNASNMSGIYSG